ncbi:MAG: TadE/TadG family type IV pilus assembly protein [Actinomycetota bacterium]
MAASNRTRGGTDDAGVVTTEVAVVMPMAIILMMMVFQVAFYWHAKQSVDLAAEEAVEAASDAAATPNDGVDGARAILSQVGQVSNVRMSLLRDVNTGIVRVSIRADAPALLPFGDWEVEGTAEGRIEEFVSEQDR